MEYAQPENTGKKLTLFRPGAEWRGNAKGRPPGSRNKISELFIDDLYAAWREHGPDIIRYSIVKNPVAVLQAVSQLVPKDFQVRVEAGESFRTLLQAINSGTLPPRQSSEDE
jgi:hypothetical protein